MSAHVIALRNVSFSIDDKYQRKYTREFYVVSTVVDEGLAWGAVGIGPGMVHPSDAGARCIGGGADLVKKTKDHDVYRGDGYLFLVKIEYGPWNPIEHWPGGDPLLAPLIVRFEPSVEEMPIFTDWENNPIVNSVGDYFDPPLMGKVPKGTLTVIRNEDQPDITLYNQYTNTINDDVWNNWPQYNVYAAPIAQPEGLWAMTANFASSGKFYWPVKYQFECNPLGFVAKVPNRGTRQLGGSSASGGTGTGPVKILDKLGQPLEEPAWLDDDGHVITEPTKDNIVFREFKPIKPESFAVFNLDYLTIPGY